MEAAIKGTTTPAGVPTDPEKLEAFVADTVEKALGKQSEAFGKQIAGLVAGMTAANQPPEKAIRENGAKTPEQAKVFVKDWLRGKVLGQSWRMEHGARLEKGAKALHDFGKQHYGARYAGGEHEDTPDVIKAVLTTSDANLGAEYVGREYMRELIEAGTYVAPFRQFVRVWKSQQNAITVPRTTTKYTAARKGQSSGGNPVAASASNLATDDVNLTAKTLISLTAPLTRELVADPIFPLVETVARYLGEAIGVAESLEVAIGNGTTQAKGIYNFTITSVAQAGSALDVSDLQGLLYRVPRVYRIRNDVAWVMNDDAMRLVATMKDDNGRLIFQPSERERADFPTLLGRPILELDDFAGIGTTGDPTVIYVGSWGDSYHWFDRQGLEIESSMDGDNFGQHTVQWKGVTRSDGQEGENAGVRRLTGVKV